jgi:1-acyl-sn-glycerol-3-phosphate acyltransferase
VNHVGKFQSYLSGALLKTDIKKYPYPRRNGTRFTLRFLIRAAFFALGDFEVIGKENLPPEGPLLLVSNHFSFLDPLAMIKIAPWQLEFLGGTKTPNAPALVDWLRHVWGIIPVFRGSVSRDTFVASQSILQQKGVLTIFPEGGNWATVLRPARPGVAFLAVQTGAPLIPIGLHGFDNFFPSLRKGKRPKLTIKIGKLFGPYKSEIRGRPEREKLDELGHEIMRRISELIPNEKRGFYSDDPAIREAAKGTEVYPWADLQES